MAEVVVPGLDRGICSNHLGDQTLLRVLDSRRFRNR